jgi:hypothetical protein
MDELKGLAFDLKFGFALYCLCISRHSVSLVLACARALRLDCLNPNHPLPTSFMHMQVGGTIGGER